MEERPDTDDDARAAGRSWWIAGSVLCLLAGLVLYLAGRPEWAFVAGVLGVVAWFMNMRGVLQRKNVEAEAERAREEGEEDGGEFDEDEVA